MRLRAYLPAALILLGCAKAAGVLWLAPKIGAPAWIALTAAAMWAAGPLLAARWMRRRMDRRGDIGAIPAAMPPN